MKLEGFGKELNDNILRFWSDKMVDHQYGGFYGKMDGNNILHPKANKGVILNARILWTFSAAYRVLEKKEYLEIAHRAFEYINTYFIDTEYGGVYWELDYLGKAVDTKKQTYALGFALYGFSEYYRVTQDEKALNLAIDIFRCIEKCHDQKLGGYLEAYTRDWQPIEDVRLSEKDANEVKTMNTHLHILEPYTNLLRIWKAEELIEAQKRLIDVFINRILNKDTFHLELFFDEQWMIKSDEVSYGHDIEASWLLYEAAEILGEQNLTNEIKTLSLRIADAACEGLMPDGSMIYEKKGNRIDEERHWWVQAEAVVGFMYAYKNSGNEKYRQKALKLWSYIQNKIKDKELGEWLWSRLPGGEVNLNEDKAGFWKCPYHNGRMCLEMIENFKFD